MHHRGLSLQAVLTALGTTITEEQEVWNHEAMVFGEGLDLRVPLPQGRAAEAGQHDQGRALAAGKIANATAPQAHLMLG